jgi:hypothetical protein
LQDSLNGFAKVISLEAYTGNQTWPFVTINDFEMTSYHVRQQTGIARIEFSPLVLSTQVAAWNAYSQERRGWIDESQSISKTLEEATSTVRRLAEDKVEEDSVPDVISNEIFRLVNDTAKRTRDICNSTPCAPIWQVSPMDHVKPINYNLLSKVAYNRTIYNGVNQSRQCVLGSIEYDETDADLLDRHGSSVDGGSGFAHSVMACPIFGNPTYRTSAIRGYLIAVIDWVRVLSDVMPEGVNGIYAVVRNSCYQNYTFRLDGPDVTIVGPGEHTGLFWTSQTTLVNISGYLGSPSYVPRRGDCFYTLSLYPSEDMLATFETDTPSLFAIAVSCAFIVVISSFWLHERMIRRKDNVITSIAVKSSMIVASLFPGTLKDRLFKDSGSTSKSTSHNEHVRQAGLRFADYERSESAPVREDTRNEKIVDKPIADLFPVS